MDYSADSTIAQQTPSTNTQSQQSYLIVATVIINDSGGTKVAKDFTVNIIGKIVGKSFILASFQALSSPEVKIVSMQEGNYSLSITNAQGYKVSQQNECQGDIKPGEVKTCLITLNDEATATAPFPPQTGGGGEQTPPPPQCPNGQHLDQTTQQCVPNTPPPPPPTQTDTPFHFTAAGDFRDNTKTDENMAANNPEIVLILGDFSYNGNAAQWWSKNMNALNNLNVIAGLGNHDEPNDEFLELFPLNGGKWEFIKKVGNVAFVAFDTETNDPSTVDPLLAQAQADPTVDHIIPFGHKTVFTPTPGNPLKPDANKGYFDVFKKYDKIRMILGGHNHFYARMNAVSGTDFIYVTVGNGGANPHQDSGEKGSPPQQYVRSNGALHCDVNKETISCKMISNEGKIWDEFTITPGNPPASKQNPAQAPGIINQQIPSIIIQQIPSIDKRSQPSFGNPLVTFFN
ncbi:MAG TPA: metallophosphoesterase [Nitrososphaeraceae archaeon]|nr:metallophosphoesterase [Nitrososphaeraceae archaeon]